MASAQTVAHSFNSPKVVPLPVPAAISQEDIETIILLRNAVRQRAAQLEFLENEMLAKLAAGAPCESGVHTAEIKQNWRRNVSWKSVTIRLAERLELNGEAYCANVLEHTKPTLSLSLAID